MSQPTLFPEESAYFAALDRSLTFNLFISAIPSHDEQNDPLPDQEQWAESALELFADLYGGATAFKSFAGIFKSETGTYLRDRPILIESYVPDESARDVSKATELFAFARRMASEASQEAVLVVINQAMFLIKRGA